jgi:hypothetical protein
MALSLSAASGVRLGGRGTGGASFLAWMTGAGLKSMPETGLISILACA